MGRVEVKPSIFTNYLIKIGATDTYEAAVSSFKFTPNSSIMTLKGGTPADVFTAVTTPTFVCDMKVAQDWETPESLCIFLFNNQGETVDVEFSPLGSGPKFTATLILSGPEIGGDIDAWGEFSVQHGVSGRPLFVPGTVI